MGKLIKNIDLAIIDYGRLTAIFKELLRIAFTPRMENFIGYVGAIDFFTNLIDIADSSASEFDNLKTIPVYYVSENVKLEYDARLRFKKSCQEIIMRLETTPSFLDLDFLH